MSIDRLSQLKSLRLYGMATAWSELLAEGPRLPMQPEAWLDAQSGESKHAPMPGMEFPPKMVDQITTMNRLCQRGLVASALLCVQARTQRSRLARGRYIRSPISFRRISRKSCDLSGPGYRSGRSGEMQDGSVLIS